ncbi:MAG TPA: outer membrane beta-barrel protein [Xanthobacteraceae bacterium]|nr:outer membrane beta-barrel protein [Xanthobacteraceae bacterium]
MKNLLLTGIALVIIGSGSAMAADLSTRRAPAPVYKAPPMMPVTTWTGCYIGGNGGGGWAQKSFTFDGADDGSHTASGAVAGGQVGCDYQFSNNFVIGIQGMFDWADLTGSNTVPSDATESWATHVESFGTVDGRLGFLVVPTFMLYAKGGVAFVNEKFTFSDPTGSVTASDTRTGGDVGAGLDWMFTPNWDLFVEYDHMFFDSKDIDFPGPFTENIAQKVDKVQAGINFRFGGFH